MAHDTHGSFTHASERDHWGNTWGMDNAPHVHTFTQDSGVDNVRLCSCGARRTRYVDAYGNVVYTTHVIVVR